MELFTVAYPVIVIAVAVLSRLPFMKFPMDEDFAFYAYRSCFARQGIRWKDDVIIVYPMIKMIAFDAIYGKRPQKGVFRIRVFFAVMHSATSLIVYAIVNELTGNPSAALFAGGLYAFFGSAPALFPHSVNFEQVYLPFVISGAFLLSMGEGWTAYAGFLFGFAVIPKFATGIYIPFMALGVWYGYGFWHAIIFICAAAVPVIAALLADFFLGYLDSKARRQFRTRLAVALRLPKLKELFGSRVGDVKMIIGQTLPLWVLGVPALVASFAAGVTGAASGVMGGGLWAILFTAVTLSMIPSQKAFSRYHYIPLVGILAVATGVGADWLAVKGGTVAIAAGSLFAASLAYSIFNLHPFYIRPLSNETLAKHDKFDQYIYAPRVGRLLGRLAAMRGERGRIFVWGSFTQIYIYSGMPATDTYIHFAVGPWDEEAMAGYFDTVIGGLVKHRPVYLVKDFSNLDIEYLEEITGLKYKLLKVVLARFPIYRLESTVPPAIDPLSLPWREKMRIFEKLTRGKPLPGVDMADSHKGDHKTAIKECRKALRLNPGDTEALSYLGLLYYEIHIDEKAAGVYAKIIKNFPKRRDARPMLARYRISEGNLDEAERLIDEEIRIFGHSRGTLYFSGNIFANKGMYKAAVKEFEKLTALAPEEPEFLLPLAEAYAECGQREKAVDAYENALAAASGPKGESIRSTAASAIAAIKAKENRENPESMTLKRYLEKYPNSALLKYALASALEKEGRKEEARGFFHEVAHGSAGNNTKGAALFRMARLEDGGIKDQMQMLSQCIRLNPYHAGAKEMLKKLETRHARA
ncbi:MAG: tetratricopeptide repeat protein [Nitrospinota bacterium]